MKTKFLVFGVPIVLIGIMLSNGLISRESSLEEAKAWANENLGDYQYTSSYTSEKTLYDEYGNPYTVEVPDGAVVTVHWTGELVERNDEWGKNWCFTQELIASDRVIKTRETCKNLSRNTFTGKLISSNP